MPKIPKLRRLNPVAKALRTPVFRPRRVKKLKGKGSYNRRPKHRGGGFVICRGYAFSGSKIISGSIDGT
jgi:stalled ribosome alternative rescue factor ArfA